MSLESSNLTKAKPRHYLAIGLFIVFIAAAIWAVFNQTALRDWYILHTYKPPQAIVQLAVSDTMSAYAKTLFYVNRHELEDKNSFSKNCTSTIEQTYVIGCYHSMDNGIYLLNVSDPNLNGIIQVTAAYEMLHAGYARLSSAEQAKLNSQMWSYYVSSVKSAQIKQQMAAYAQSEPKERYDELYSVLATEVGTLPNSLENHYRIYFFNREKIVKMYNSYQNAFLSRINAVTADDNELIALKQQINADESRLSYLLTQLNTNKQQILSQQNSAGYLSEVTAYNIEVNSYNLMVIKVSSEIGSYNNLVNNRNSLAIEERSLIQAISSKPSPIKSKLN